MKIIGAVPFRETWIWGEVVSFYDVLPRFRSHRAGDDIVFSVAVMLFNEEGDRGDYHLVIEMTDPEGETLYKSTSTVPAGDAGCYTMQIQTIAAEITGPGLYHLDISLEDTEAISLPLIFTAKEENS